MKNFDILTVEKSNVFDLVYKGIMPYYTLFRITVFWKSLTFDCTSGVLIECLSQTGCGKPQTFA